MLSNPLHRFPPYHAIPSTTLLSNAHVPAGHLHAGGLDTLAQGSHYALQQLQQHVGVHNPHLARPGPQQQAKHRQHPYGPARSTGVAGPIRRRISRACDQCNQLRTKCDGQHPCAHCIEFGLGCEYIRERKKRGKASRKDLAAQAAAQAAAAAAAAQQNGAKSPAQDGQSGEQRTDGSQDLKPMMGSDMDKNELNDELNRSQRTGSMDSLGDMSHQGMTSHPGAGAADHLDSPNGLDLNGYGGGMHPGGYDSRQASMGSLGSAHMMNGHHAGYGNGQAGMSSYPDLPYALQTQSPTSYTAGNAAFRMGTSPLSAYPLADQTTSPGWMSMSSPPAQYASHMAGSGFQQQAAQQQQHAAHQAAQQQQQQHAQAQAAQQVQQQAQQQQAQLRYPVLEPLIPHLGNIIPVSTACDLIDLYFASSSSAQMHPMSPYVLGFVFRKKSFLHPTKPRVCSPALLASMLWVAAQTSDAPFLTSVPSARGKICQKLLELTVSLLKPLIHTPSGDASPVSSPVIDGVALGGLGVAMPGSISMDALSGESGAFGAAGTLDDVVTYIHLATVVSASEYKGASLRWWNAAWSLARELKLGRELPPTAPATVTHHHIADVDADGEADDDNELLGGASGHHATGVATGPGLMTEEEREERRRIWWLVYIVDRHLALCYNRPLFLLDIECEGLRQPMDETAWQNGDGLNSPTDKPSGQQGAIPTDPNVLASDSSARKDGDASGNANSNVRVGPHFECTGHSIFGYFLPLMTILGEIVDLHHARNHPRFGVGFRSAREWDDQAAEIARHLETYEQSLARFEQRHLHHSHANATSSSGAAATSTAAGNADDKMVVVGGTGGAGSSSADAAALDALAVAGGSNDAVHDVGSPSVHSVHTTSSRMTESDIQTRIVIAYGTHVMHVLHILLTGKWDPINLLDDNDLWISSPGFITATGHAVSAAEAISSILEYDPGLEFMPFFFGIYLLQGSFLLLLIADKLQAEASPSVVKACETIIRAHEACVVTLNTEYQRNFSKVMRSALAQVRGRVPEDLGEQHQRRRELMALYRWTGDGTGLAL